jgi:prepilin-type N-terminal cleavage/methylation domain-containing protein
MAKYDLLSRFKSRLKQACLPTKTSRTKGFTLLELLVAVAIAGGIVAGLMYIVVELMGTDQRESSRSETQREMQMALDYINAELREAVYVYTGSDLDCAGGAACRPLTDYLPAALGANSVPIIAFWKQQPFPENVPGSTRASCFAAVPPQGISCLTGQSYALVVYSLSKANPTGIWSNNARITRYALTEFNSQGNLNTGYVNPGSFGNFSTWPFGTDERTGQFGDLRNVPVLSRRPPGRPDVPPVTLVDFVDVKPAQNAADLRQTGACPAGDYAVSPTDAALNRTGFTGVRSFYACVSTRPLRAAQANQAAEVDTGVNQDVILYLRGNANGRPGIIGDENFLPALETRVLSRGVLGKRPGS